MSAPRVSIGLPVYNGEAYLGRTLDDWTGQTFGDFELVVCDNASTDATPGLLADAARRDPRVVVHRNPSNVGALANANRAFARTRAPLYVLSSYDDRHAPTFLERLVAALDAAPDAVVAYGRKTLIGPDERPFAWHPVRRRYTDAAGAVYTYDAGLERALPADRVARFRAALRANDPNATMYGLFRRAALERAGTHHVHGSDRLVVAHAALLGPFAFVDAPLFAYRIHASSTYHLTRAEWMAREAGPGGAGSAWDGARTLARYLAATARAGLGPSEQARAVAAVLGYAVRPAVIHRLLVPGPDNYWGWTHGPGARRPAASPPPVHPDDEWGEWAWLQVSGSVSHTAQLHRASASEGA